MVTTSAGANRRGQALLVVQLALAFLMLATTALIVISLARLTVQDSGYEVDGIITGGTLLDLTPGLAEDPWEDRDFVMDLLKEIDTMPGVAGAAAAGFPMLQDLDYLHMNNPVKVEGRSQVTEDSAPGTLLAIVSEDYFAVMDIPLLAGRLFVDTDDEKLRSNSVVVNQAFARRYFPGGHAIGQRISLSNGAKWDTIVGWSPMRVHAAWIALRAPWFIPTIGLVPPCCLISISKGGAR
jgi:hypothetical protein